MLKRMFMAVVALVLAISFQMPVVHADGVSSCSHIYTQPQFLYEVYRSVDDLLHECRVYYRITCTVCEGTEQYYDIKSTSSHDLELINSVHQGNTNYHIFYFQCYTCGYYTSSTVFCTGRDGSGCVTYLSVPGHEHCVE